MTNDTLESMKGPIVVVSLIIVFGLAIVFGQNLSDADKLVGFVITGLVAVGYITSHQQKALLAAQGAIQPMPEYAKQAKEDLVRLAAIDDAKVTVEQGTEDSPNPVEIDNPMPVWKRAGFKDKDELLKLAEME